MRSTPWIEPALEAADWVIPIPLSDHRLKERGFNQAALIAQKLTPTKTNTQAMLRLHARRIRQLFGLVEDLNTLPLRSRLAKQLVHLVRSYGVPSLSDGSEMRISLQLAQEELAQLLGASRQRVNQELKAMEREDAIRIEPGGLVVRDREALMRIAEADN